ncbi:MAG: Phosphate transport system regulator [Thermococcales archaeon 44_46]|nr:MAG: Phosphate transport system regulator [Thermococcales archaeon 44_46]HIH72397.1 phosphate uptake regulator PhoU [Thermococcaceae archaeon]
MRKLLELGLKQMEKLLQEMGETTIECANSIEKILDREWDNIEDKSSKLHILREEIIDIATELLVRYQPVASDLRYIQASIDVSYDLYRISRYAMEIERTIKITNPNCEFRDVKNALKTVNEMIKTAVEAFLSKDELLVGKLIEMDTKIDRRYIDSIKALKEQPDLCKAVEALIIRHLERISDHAKYIGGATIYVKNGKRI